MNVGKIGAQNTVISKNTFTGKNISMQANTDYSVDQPPTDDDSKTLLFVSGLSAIVLAVLAIVKIIKVKDLKKVIVENEKQIADAKATIAENEKKFTDAQATVTELKQASENALKKTKTTKESVSSIVSDVKNIVKKVFSRKKTVHQPTIEAASIEVMNEGESKVKKKSIFAPIKKFFSGNKTDKAEETVE